jgi:hypothetical protein
MGKEIQNAPTIAAPEKRNRFSLLLAVTAAMFPVTMLLAYVAQILRHLLMEREIVAILFFT